MAIGTFRIGHAGAAKNNHKKVVKRDSCTTGGFITSPSSGQVVDVSKDVMFAWDSSCLNITGADIYLYAPYQATSLIQMFQNVDYSKGSYNATLKPKWWNSTDSVNLQLTIVQTGSPEFNATLPPGPIWTAQYNSSDKITDESSVGTTSSGDSNITQVNNLNSEKHGGLSKGSIAAAVLIPLIVVGIALAAYIKITRKREEARRKRWSEAVDKRMSVISTDWRSMSTRGVEAAMRASMADPNRNSVWSSAGNAGVGIPRPSSTYAVEGTSTVQPDMTQIRRPGVGLRGPVASAAGSTGRVSRVSFAADTRFSRSSTGDGLGSCARPSGESRRTGIPSRAFHSAYMPPVRIPSRLSEYVPDVETNNTGGGEDNNGILLSPTQRNGPHDLTADDIHAHMNGDTQSESRPSLDAVMPALTMMRTGNGSQADLLLERSDQPSVAPLRIETSIPTPPPPVKSPITEAMPMPPLTGAAMSPDDMLRAYAERRRTGGSGMTSPPGTPAPTIAFPMPVVNPGGVMSPPSTMRTLYSPPGATSGTGLEAATAHTDDSQSATNPFRKSLACPSTDIQHADEDMHFGAAH